MGNLGSHQQSQVRSWKWSYGASTTCTKSVTQYKMAIAKGKPVQKPMMTELKTALGTVRVGFRHSSARCNVASMPVYMKQGEARPVKKHTPSDQPVSLKKVAHTKVWDCFAGAIARAEMKIVKNVTSVSTTE